MLTPSIFECEPSIFAASNRYIFAAELTIKSHPFFLKDSAASRAHGRALSGRPISAGPRIPHQMVPPSLGKCYPKMWKIISGDFFWGPTISPISPDHYSWVDCLMRRQWLFNGLKTKTRPICANLQDTSFEFSQGPHQKRKRYIIVLLTWYLRSHGILSCQESATFKTRCFNHIKHHWRCLNTTFNTTSPH